MARKLALLGMAIVTVVMAGAIPATATASPQLFEGTSPLKVGAEIKATSTNAVTTNTGLGKLECANVTISAQLQKNSGTAIEATGISGETTTCQSTGKFGNILGAITKPTLISLVTTGADKGTLSLTFIADVGVFECDFAGSGTFTYTTGTDVLKVAGIELKSPEFCEPEEGVPTFEGDFTITTKTGTPVTIPGPELGPLPSLSEAGVPLKEGATVVATSTNAVATNTVFGKLECATLTISAELLKASENQFNATSTGGKAESCQGTEGSETFPLTVTQPTLLSLATTGNDAGTLGLIFGVDSGAFECLFEGEGAFSYTTGTDVLNVSGVKFKAAELCESEEGGSTFEGDFTLETSNGTPITIPTAPPSPVLKESGVVLSEGGSIRATSTNAITTRTALGRLECGELSFTTAVDQNSEGEIALSTTGAETKSCSAEGEPLTLTEPNLELFTEGGDTATLSVSFVADVGSFECPFEGEGAVPYTTNTDVLKASGLVLESSSEICEPLVGKPGFEGDFTLTTANGTQVKFT